MARATAPQGGNGNTWALPYVSLADLPKGSYILHIKLKDKVVVRQLIKT